MRDALVSALIERAEQDPNIILLTGDLGFGVFEEYAERHPKQFFNVGIGEQNMVGVAAGLALSGKKIVVYSIGNFPTLRCLEQIRNDVCYHDLDVILVCQGGGFNYGGLGMSHHATEDLSIMRAMPGIKVVAPSSRSSAKDAINDLLSEGGPGYLRLEKTNADKWLENHYCLGKANVLVDGDDVAIFAVGGIVSEAVEARKILFEKHGVSCRVIDVFTLKPFDANQVLQAAKEVKGIITIEENNLLGGLYGAVAEILCANNSCVPVVGIGMKDAYTSIVGSQDYLRSYYGIDKVSICNAALGLLAKV